MVTVGGNTCTFYNVLPKQIHPISDHYNKKMNPKKLKKKNPQAQALGRLGGSAIAKKIGKRGMSALGKKGAKSRWSKSKSEK